MVDRDKAEFSTILAGVMDVYGTSATTASLSIWWASLARYPLELVRSALAEHVQDSTSGRFAPKPADIIGRIQALDGRPGPEEAWSMIPRDEYATVVWTEEIAQAWGVARPLLTEGDQVAARMAFLERYRALVRRARDDGIPVRWTPSLGHDPSQREAALSEAVEKGRLRSEQVAHLLPNRAPVPDRILRLISS